MGKPAAIVSLPIRGFHKGAGSGPGVCARKTREDKGTVHLSCARVDAEFAHVGAVYLWAEKILLFDLIEQRGMEVVGHYGDVDDGKGWDTDLQTALRRIERGDAQTLVIFDKTRIGMTGTGTKAVCARVRAAKGRICTAAELVAVKPLQPFWRKEKRIVENLRGFP